MKKIINSLFMFMLGGIIFGSIVYAASYYAKDVLYIPEDTSWEVSNVEEALNDLYSDSNDDKVEIIEIGTCNFGELGYENTSSWSTVTFSKSYTVEDNVYLMIYQIDQANAWTNIYVRGTGKVTGNSKNLQITNKGSVNSPGCTIYWALVRMD